MKKFLCVFVLCLGGGFGYSQTRTWLCRTTEYNFGVWLPIEETYLWQGEVESNLLIEFNGSMISILSEPSKVVHKLDVAYQSEECTMYNAIDNNNQYLIVGVIDYDKSDPFLCFFLRYTNYSIYYNMLVIQ